MRRGGSYRLRFRWRDRGAARSLSVEVPADRYREARTAERTLGETFRAALEDDLAGSVARALATRLDAAGVDTAGGRLRGALAFVRSLPYATDAGSTGAVEYPRYVPETLVDCEGDCEDYAALLAGVLAAPPFDCDPALVILPGHAAVGVAPDAPGVGADAGGDAVATVRAGGREYVYLDATYDHPIGTLPASEHGREVVAVHDGRWRLGDPGAMIEHVGGAVDSGVSLDPPASARR
ncbi:hypothetical protein [Halobaculum sp. EA56]|uniref:hypothetical protein n=1 Tax=Halobaculum sp. EA56 TaxID=3421648 RepID=UPI003EB73416